MRDCDPIWWLERCSIHAVIDRIILDEQVADWSRDKPFATTFLLNTMMESKENWALIYK